MNVKYLFLILSFALVLISCAGDDGLVATVAITSPSECIKSTASQTQSYAQPDGAVELKGTDYVKFNTLINAVDPQRALDRTILDITDEQFEEIKVAATAQCNGITNTADKITALNKWVHGYVSYSEGNNNAYEVFKNHKGVCQGYSNLLKAALISQGIPCVGVNGWYVTSRDYFGHAWVYACNLSDTGAKEWFICDPTNSAFRYKLGSSSSSHLQPEMADIVLFDDEQFEYKWQYKGFNISRVKKGDTDLILPYSAGGFKLTMFNPEVALPSSVSNIYIGANITSLGETYNIIGLNAYPGQDKMCYVDPQNTEIGAANGVVYRKNYIGELTSIYYIPAQMTTITLMPIEKVEKNTILGQMGVEEIVFTEGTKVLESYAIENCPNLRTVYIPKGCKLERDAIYNCPVDVEVIEGEPTGIHDVSI